MQGSFLTISLGGNSISGNSSLDGNSTPSCSSCCSHLLLLLRWEKQEEQEFSQQEEQERVMSMWNLKTREAILDKVVPTCSSEMPPLPGKPTRFQRRVCQKRSKKKKETQKRSCRNGKNLAK